MVHWFLESWEDSYTLSGNFTDSLWLVRSFDSRFWQSQIVRLHIPMSHAQLGNEIPTWWEWWVLCVMCRILELSLFNKVTLFIKKIKGGLMVDHKNMSNGQLHWDTNFMRTMQDWELEPLSSFLCLLYSNILRRDGED